MIPWKYNGSPFQIADAFSRAKARHISRKGVHTRAVSPHRSDLKVADKNTTDSIRCGHFTRKRCITLTLALDRRHAYANIQMHPDARRARVSLPGFLLFLPQVSQPIPQQSASIQELLAALYGCQLFTWLPRPEWNNETERGRALM